MGSDPWRAMFVLAYVQSFVESPEELTQLINFERDPQLRADLFRLMDILSKAPSTDSASTVT